MPHKQALPLPKPTYWLTYAGTLPFIACLTHVWYFNVAQQAYQFDAFAIFLNYAIAIQILICISHWATILHQGEKLSLTARWVLLPLSNIITLWTIFHPYVELGSLTTILFSGLLFIMLYAIDYYFHKKSCWSASYIRLRRNVTAVVILCHIGLFICLLHIMRTQIIG